MNRHFVAVQLFGVATVVVGATEFFAVVSRNGLVGMPVCFALALAGAALTLSTRSTRSARIARIVMSSAALTIGLLVLAGSRSSPPAGAEILQGPSLLGGVAVLMAGSLQLLLQAITNRVRLYVAAALAGVMLVAGVVALFLHLTEVSSLLPAEWQSALRVRPAASLAVVLLSVGSFVMLMTVPEARRFWQEREDRWIAIISMVFVGAVVASSALAGAGIFMRHSVHVFAHTLENSVAANAAMVESSLVQARRRALEVASVARGLAANGELSFEVLERLIGIPEFGVRSIRRRHDPSASLVERPLRVPLKYPARSALVWDGEWLLETHVPGVLQGRAFEELVVEIRLDKIAHLVHNGNRVWHSGALVICAAQDADSLRCFPSARSEVPVVVPVSNDGQLLPIARAREGVAGVVVGRDMYSSVVAAYSPVGRTGLLISQKVATYELFGTVRDHIWWLVLGVFGLVAMSVAFLPRLVQPLVNRLTEARARLQVVLENIPDVVATTDADGRIVSVNTAAERAFGYRAAELKGSSIGRVVSRGESGGRARPVETLAELANAPDAAYQIIGKRHDGSCFPGELRVSQFQLNRQALFVAVIRNTKEQRAAMQALANSREMFRVLVENLPDLVIRFSADMRCIYASPVLNGYFGIDPNAIFGRTAVELARNPVFPNELIKPLFRVFARGKEETAEFSLQRGEETRYFHTRFMPEFGSRGCERVLCVTRDVTAVRQAEVVLREVTKHHAYALEQERKRIAREVHDELGQVLTGIKTELGLMRLRSNNPQLAKSLEPAQELTDRAINTVRDVVRALRPSTLDLGIVYALQWLRSDFEKRTGARCHLAHSEDFDPALDDHTATHLFRIAQESLTNIERHARASVVRMRIEIAKDTLILEVADNGVGFDPKRTQGKSFGLMGIKERATMINGKAAIVSGPGAGTRVEVIVALAPVHASTIEGGRHDSCAAR